MALTAKLSDTAVNTKVDAVCALANSGKLRFYDGSQPATADTDTGAQVLLAELTLNAAAFGAAVDGVATAAAITPDSSANAGGTAAWFRVVKSDGTTKLWDGSVGTANKTISAATQANPAVLTKTGHGLVSGDTILISGFTGNWVPANGIWRVNYVSADTFSIPVNATGFGAMTGTPVYADANIVLDNVVIVLGGTVSLTAFTYSDSQG